MTVRDSNGIGWLAVAVVAAVVAAFIVGEQTSSAKLENCNGRSRRWSHAITAIVCWGTVHVLPLLFLRCIAVKQSGHSSTATVGTTSCGRGVAVVFFRGCGTGKTCSIGRHQVRMLHNGISGTATVVVVVVIIAVWLVDSSRGEELRKTREGYLWAHEIEWQQVSPTITRWCRHNAGSSEVLLVGARLNRLYVHETNK